MNKTPPVLIQTHKKKNISNYPSFFEKLETWKMFDKDEFQKKSVNK